MAQVESGQIRNGMKLEIEQQPYAVVNVDLVKPGKGQAFTRVKMRNLRNRRVIERTFKSNEKVSLADVQETRMRMLYREQDGVVFMDEESYEQITLPNALIGEQDAYLREEELYDIVLYKGEVVDFTPPTFMEMTVEETAPGERGNTTGRVLKPAKTDTGAEIQVPIFINEGERIKVDTRTGEYVGRT